MGGQQRAGMNIDQREIAINEVNLAGIDVIGLELGFRLTDETSAERSLVVAILDDRDWRAGVA